MRPRALGQERHPLERILFDRRMSQRDLARLAGVSPSTITRWIQGHDVWLSCAIKVADALNISVEELTGMPKPVAPTYNPCSCIRCLVIG